MKREIEFRGKTAKGEWVYGVYYKQEHFYGDEEEVHCIITTKDVLSNDLGLDYEEVIPETVGQYVGIKDKNGKKVYVGDIVKDEYGRIMEVVWREKFAKFAFKLIKTTGATWTENFLYADMGEWFDLADHLPEVIGTVFDKESDNE